jgi:hypothetical protein
MLLEDHLQRIVMSNAMRDPEILRYRGFKAVCFFMLWWVDWRRPYTYALVSYLQPQVPNGLLSALYVGILCSVGLLQRS